MTHAASVPSNMAMLATTDSNNDAPDCVDHTAIINDTAPSPAVAMFAGRYRQIKRWPRASSNQAMPPGYTVINNGITGIIATNSEVISYPGGKGHAYQKIINLIPPHRVYIETHVGGGAVLRNKRPARLNIAIDIDPDVIGFWSNHAINNGSSWQFINGDAVSLLKAYDFQGDEFVYADPPYLFETRRQHRPIYRYEYAQSDHVNLLGLLTALPCKVMISGYWSKLYADTLAEWYSVNFEMRTRGGSPATEYLWMNYPPPTRLHDYRYLGDNYRQRERITRKKKRWAARWAKMDILEQQAILSALDEVLNV